jgi:hypothetical protein
MPDQGEFVSIPVLAIEYVEGGNTLWVHGQDGTVLRIKVSGKVYTDTDCSAPGPHADIMAQGDVKMCHPGDF